MDFKELLGTQQAKGKVPEKEHNIYKSMDSWKIITY